MVKIHGQQKKAIEEYHEEITKSKQPIETLASIIKAEKRTVINYIQTGLIVILIILVIMAQIQGKYIQNEIQVIETCQGEIIGGNTTWQEQITNNQYQEILIPNLKSENTT